MGMFDSVWVPCPKCGTNNEWQSKAGPCALMNYNLSDAPPAVKADIGGEENANYCHKCDARIVIDVQVVAIPRVAKLERGEA